MPPINAPLILTLQLAEQDFDYFNMLRKKHFPQHINYIDAHITLFHHLPGNNFDEIVRYLTAFCSSISPLSLQVSSLKMIGNGVAYFMEDEYLSSIHKQLRQLWLPTLISQDKQKLHPHITIQNKVTAFKAKSLYHDLAVGFTPFPIEAIGMQLWEYLGGPWKLLQTFPFTAH